MASPYEDALNTMDQMDQRLANWQDVPEPQSMDLPSESNPTHPGLALSESPTTGGAMEQGLGLAKRGLEAITPSRDTLYKFAQGLEAAGAVGRGATPLYMQQQHVDLQRQQMASQAEERKQMMALRIQEQQEQKRQHNMGIMWDLVKSENLDALKQFGETENFPIAKNLAMVANKKDLAQLPYYVERGWLTDDDVNAAQKWTPGQTRERLKALDKRASLVDAASVKSLDLQTALKDQAAGKPLDAYQEDLLQVHEEEADLRRAKAEALKKKATDQGPSPVRNDTIDIPSIATAGMPFASIPRDAVVTPDHLSRARAAGFDVGGLQPGMPLQSALTHLGLQQSGKIAQTQGFGRGMGVGDVPVGVESNLYTKLLPDGTAQAIHDPGMGKIEAGKQGYRDTARFKENLDRADKAKTAIRMLGDLERYAKEIVTAQGGPIETTLQGWKLALSGVSRTGALTNLTAPNGKKLTVGEVAALYDDKSNQVADQLARGGGMVGVATEQDTMRSMKGLAGRYETANMASEKFGTFKSTFGNNLLQEYDRAYGREGVPATLRSHLSKGELPTQSKLPAKQFLQQQEKAYRDQGFQDAEIRDLLKRDFRDMGY